LWIANWLSVSMIDRKRKRQKGPEKITNFMSKRSQMVLETSYNNAIVSLGRLFRRLTPSA
jgi:hypothetical protein